MYHTPIPPVGASIKTGKPARFLLDNCSHKGAERPPSYDKHDIGDDLVSHRPSVPVGTDTFTVRNRRSGATRFRRSGWGKQHLPTSYERPGLNYAQNKTIKKLLKDTTHMYIIPAYIYVTAEERLLQPAYKPFTVLPHRMDSWPPLLAAWRLPLPWNMLKSRRDYYSRARYADYSRCHTSCKDSRSHQSRPQCH